MVYFTTRHLTTRNFDAQLCGMSDDKHEPVNAAELTRIGWLAIDKKPMTLKERKYILDAASYIAELEAELKRIKQAPVIHTT